MKRVLFFVVCILDILLILIFFFFSSRRRHTRCSRDWSSDVCSSDLFLGPNSSVPIAAVEFGPRNWFVNGFIACRFVPEQGRSEERRVGKECRCRWWV